MEIVYKKLKELKPYENNPRKNDKAVDALAESIKDYGFKVPCVIDADGVLVTGHTRYKAAKKLGLKEIPCIIADDLTPEQIDEFRIADNRTAENALWDKRKLLKELNKLPKFEPQKFGFTHKEITPHKELGWYGDERGRTFDAYNLYEFDEEEADGFYQMPHIYDDGYIPSQLIGFNYMLSTDERNCGLHFFIDDYQFERIWNQPEKYISRMTEFEGSLTPDFSLYMDMPMPMKIWNVYRSRLIGQMLQRNGVKVCPTISWAEPATYKFCFDGIEKGATVSVSTVGVKNSKDAMKVYKDGMDALIKKIQPKNIIVYGGKVDYDYGNAAVYYYENAVTERLSEYGR